MRFFCIFSFFLYFFPSGYSQILNADKFGRGVDSTHVIKVVWDLGINLNKQQSLLITLDTKLDLAYWWRRSLLVSVSNFNLFRSGSKNLLNGGFSHLRWRYLGNKLWQPEVFAQYQMDGVRGMRHRALAGSNLRINAWRGKKGSFACGIGAMYEFEAWDYSGVPAGTVIIDDSPIKNHFIKLNTYLSYHQQINKVLDIEAIFYFQSRPDSYFVLPRLSHNAAFTFNISKHIKFTVLWALFYDAAPPVPINKLAYSAMNKITFSW